MHNQQTAPTQPTLKSYNLQELRFPSLIIKDFGAQEWAKIKLTDLSEPEAQFFRDLVLFLPNFPPINTDHLLLVQAKAGVLKRVYPPEICRDGDRIVLQLGGNLLPIQPQGKQLLCGSLTGTLQHTAHRWNPAVLNLSCLFRSPEVENTVYVFQVGVSLQSPQIFNSPTAQALLRGAVDLLPVLKQRYIQVIKLSDLLPKGLHRHFPLEFAITGFSVERGKPGQTDSHRIHLADGRVVYAVSNSKDLLESAWQPEPGVAYKLVIVEANLFSNGKYQVVHTIRKMDVRAETSALHHAPQRKFDLSQFLPSQRGG